MICTIIMAEVNAPKLCLQNDGNDTICMDGTKCTQSLSGLEFFCSNSGGISVSNAMNIFLFMLTEHLIIELIQVKKHTFTRRLQKILIILGSSICFQIL